MEVVAPDELARRKEEAEWRLWQSRHGLDVRAEHARLALKVGDVLTVPDYTGELWWFVRDVNGIDRTITAATIIFEQVRERTFPFDLVELKRLWHRHEANEARAAYEATERKLGQSSDDARRSRAA